MRKVLQYYDLNIENAKISQKWINFVQFAKPLLIKILLEADAHYR